ncbi:uncharacterized protein LOC119399893 isoform X1 [Rhipicephalus sanguineus]|uniref:uncharacterized protein LOC119399893 isoform X1 n=1 Tax=Rhipicephalus sanguineus TaxID=34632 RepID=UPI0018945B25|nr:uncharacterized protein LOC119399893 isoform X1 [Rhipicephalus sanguineus]
MTTNVALSLMLAHVCWVHCSGQSDYSRIPTKDQKYMEDARRLLEGRAKLFLERGVNGIIDKNKRICWTSKRMVPSSLGYHHTLQFFDRGGKGSERKQKRDTYWYVGLKDSIPSVLVNAYDKRKLDPEVSGDYILYFARPTCFLVGNETGKKAKTKLPKSSRIRNVLIFLLKPQQVEMILRRYIQIGQHASCGIEYEPIGKTRKNAWLPFSGNAVK